MELHLIPLLSPVYSASSGTPTESFEFFVIWGED